MEASDKTRVVDPKYADPELEVSEDEIPTDEDPEDEVPGNGTTDVIDGAYYQKFITKFKLRDRARELPQPPPSEPDKDDDVYTFSPQKEGLAVIINNEHFKGNPELTNREGAKQDARNLKKVFKHLGFQIKYYKDLTARQMVNTLQTFAGSKKYNLDQVDCFACVILSHGDNNAVKHMPEKEDVIHGTDGKPVRTRHLLSIFNDKYCPELQGKPRLFFLQACRGKLGKEPAFIADGQRFITVLESGRNVQPTRSSKDATDAAPGHLERQNEEQEREPDEGQEDEDENRIIKSAQDQEHEDDDEDEDQNRQDQEHTDEDERPLHFQISPSPIYKDFLALYASVPGHAAWRNSTDGSWMIQCLTKVMLSEDVFQRSLTSLLREVTWNLAMVMANQKRKTSVPCVMSMLTKEVYFKKKN